MVMALVLLAMGADLFPHHLGVTISGKVFYGSKDSFDPDKGLPVGTVRSKEVYLEIPAYKKLIEEGIDKDSARGTKLLRQATKTFYKCVHEVGKTSRSALIVEEGGISGYPVRDLTPLIIKNMAAKLKAV